MCGEENKCGCNDEGCSEEMSMEDVVFHADAKVDALINLLIEKKIINDEEFIKSFELMYKEDGDSEVELDE